MIVRKRIAILSAYKEDKTDPINLQRQAKLISDLKKYNITYDNAEGRIGNRKEQSVICIVDDSEKLERIMTLAFRHNQKQVLLSNEDRKTYMLNIINLGGYTKDYIGILTYVPIDKRTKNYTEYKNKYYTTIK